MANILVISPTPTHPQDAGNRTRIFSLLSSLKDAGHKIHFALVNFESGNHVEMENTWDSFFNISYSRPKDSWMKQKYDSCIQKLRISNVLPYRIDDWYTVGISHQLITILEKIKPDTVLVEYVFLSKAFECFGLKTLKILDTHDIFSNRHRIYQAYGIKPQWFYTTVKEEKKALNRADIVIAIQKKDAEYFSLQTDRPVITVGHLVQRHLPELNAMKNNRILFVGSGNPINVDAIRWFISNVFSLVRRKIPDVELEIVGECASNIEQQIGLILTGRVDDIASCYDRTQVVVNPVRFGTGFKIKTIEALAMGKPLVTTTHGSIGLENLNKDAFSIANTPKEFVNTIVHILNSEKLREKLRCGSQNLINSYNRSAIQPLLEILRNSI